MTDRVFSRKNKDGESLDAVEQAVELLECVVPDTFIDRRVDFEILSLFLDTKVTKNKKYYLEYESGLGLKVVLEIYFININFLFLTGQ